VKEEGGFRETPSVENFNVAGRWGKLDFKLLLLKYGGEVYIHGDAEGFESYQGRPDPLEREGERTSEPAERTKSLGGREIHFIDETLPTWGEKGKVHFKNMYVYKEGGGEL